MALETIQLDTLNWDQMVTAVRNRIPADSKGLWTLHAPVDPGVTLLELFAWQLDQRIYWMNQVPDSLTLASLRLWGDAPLAAKPAVTALQLTNGGAAAGPLPVAGAGTLMRRGDQNPPLLFTLSRDVALLPLTSDPYPVRVILSGTDRTPDWMHGRSIPLLPRGAQTGSVEFLINVSDPVVPPSKDAPMSFLFELDTSRDIRPEWLAASDPAIAPPATLTWLYQSSGKSTPVAFPATGVNDGTGGLRRSGIVRLPVPTDWVPEKTGTATFVYKLLLQIDAAQYSTPPRLAWVSPNASLATHQASLTKYAPTSDWLHLPGRVISLAGIPGGSSLAEFPPIEDSVNLRVFERDGNWHSWNRVSDFSTSGPADRVFAVNRARGEVSFGDGLTGRLPIVQDGQAKGVEIQYTAGGGTAGNVGGDLSWVAVRLDAAQPPPLTATNLIPGDGGAESESVADAQARSAAKLREVNRAVTSTDYENLVLTTPGAAFQRAHAEFGLHPDFPCTRVAGAVSIFAVPYAPRDEDGEPVDEDQFVESPQPDDGVLAALRDRLNAARLLGTQIFVLPPKYRPVWLDVDVAADGSLSSMLREKVARGLRSFLDPLTGGDGSGWPFGGTLRPSALLRQVQIVLGSDADVLSVGIRLSGKDDFQDCQDVPISSYELPALRQVKVQVHARTVASGGLR